MGLDALGKIDEVIHGRMRLGIMVYLADAEAADFTELKTVLEATQGNLSVHIKKLEEAGYVAVAKSFVNNKPLTRVTITCLLYTSPSPRDRTRSRMPSSA